MSSDKSGNSRKHSQNSNVPSGEKLYVYLLLTSIILFCLNLDGSPAHSTPSSIISSEGKRSSRRKQSSGKATVNVTDKSQVGRFLTKHLNYNGNY